MIVRVLEEGQYEVDGATLARLEALDAEFATSLETRNESTFAKLLAALIADVRANGRPVDAETIVPSDLVLPAPNSSLEDVSALLSSEDVSS